jgi:hypothetical protein
MRGRTTPPGPGRWRGTRTPSSSTATNNIAGGNTANKWIYWDGANPGTYSSNALFPSLTDTQFLVAVNNGGAHDLVWNAEGIATKVIDTALIGDAAVGTAQIQNAAITNALIANLAVDTAKIVDAAIVTAKLGDLSATTAKINDAAVTTAKISNLAVTTALVADAAITNAKIGSLAVASANIQDAAITTAKIATANITTALIADANITTAKIADANITTAKIADANITTAKIADANITTAKIADANITTAKIIDANITTLKIADNAVTVPAAATGTNPSVSASVIGGQPVYILGVCDGANAAAGAYVHTLTIKVDGTTVKTGTSINAPDLGGTVRISGMSVTHLYTPSVDATSSFSLTDSEGRSSTIIIIQAKR